MRLCAMMAAMQQIPLNDAVVWLYLNGRAGIGDGGREGRGIVSRDYERRSGKDRRQDDEDLPGGKERRRQVESRKPEIVEVELNEAEWEMHFGSKRLIGGGADVPVTIEVSELFGRLSK